MSSSLNGRLAHEDHPGLATMSSHGQAIENGSPVPAIGPATRPPRRKRNPALEQTMSEKILQSTDSKKPNTTRTRVRPPKKAAPTEGEKRAKRLLKRVQKADKRDSRSQLVFTAARSTIAILETRGISCALFGSLACKLYGEFRDPKDVDILVLQPPTSPTVSPYSDEELKKLLADADPDHYYLKLPRNPEAPYRILYYREEQLECKVDILIPGTMHLPDLQHPSSSSSPSSQANIPISPTASSPGNQITIVSGIPVIPFSLLLLHKLQGWSDHRSAPEQFKRHKQHQDAADIRRLLAMTDLVKLLQQTQPWTNTDLFSPDFQVLTKQRVKDYCKEFPMRAQSWKLLGFETK